MTYTIRKGIVLKNVCGEWLLIATGDATEHCMYVREANDTLAYYWQMIEKGLNREEIIQCILQNYAVSMNQVEKDFDQLVRNLYNMNYLVKEGES